MSIGCSTSKRARRLERIVLVCMSTDKPWLPVERFTVRVVVADEYGQPFASWIITHHADLGEALMMGQHVRERVERSPLARKTDR